jgi:hypothetical protein
MGPFVSNVETEDFELGTNIRRLNIYIWPKITFKESNILYAKLLNKYYNEKNEQNHTNMLSFIGTILELKKYPIFMKFLTNFLKEMYELTENFEKELIKTQISIDFNKLFIQLWNLNNTKITKHFLHVR